MGHSYRAEQWIPFPPEKVFTFFATPQNLPRLMPASQRVRLERMVLIRPSSSSGVSARLAGAGSTMVVSFQPLPWLPVRLKWDVLIDEFVGNEFFCDRQRSGPFRSWHHCHRVRAETQSGVAGTRVTDEVEYELPLGLLGSIANAVAIRRQMKSLFAYRQKQLPGLLRSEVELDLLE